MLDQLEKFLKETSSKLAELLKDPAEGKEPNKFRRNATGNDESFKSYEEMDEIRKDFDTFQVQYLTVYYTWAASLFLPTIF